MSTVSFLNKNFYLDINGEHVYCIIRGNEDRAKNLEGYLKIDDFSAFKKGMIMLKDPVGLAKFILEEFGFSVDISSN